MKKNQLFFLFIFLYLAYHLYTLGIAPLPWFDETFFASISLSFLKTGTFVPGVTKTVQGHIECLLHGPVYYYLTALSFKVFGFGIFQFRLINLLSGFLLVGLTIYVFQKIYRPINKTIPLFLAIVFLLDPFFNMVLHEGRMDLLTTSFALLSAYFLVVSFAKHNNAYLAFSGLAGVLAVLTSPRISVILLPILIVLLFSCFKGGSFKEGLTKLLIWSVPFMVFYPLWIYFGFGGFTDFFQYYDEISTGKHSVDSSFTGGSLYIPKHEYLLIGIAAISLLYGALMQGRHYFDRMMLISVLSIFFFYWIVRDMGPYSTLILPFYYIIVGKTLHINGKITFSNPATYLLSLLLIFNISYFMLKAVQVISERNERDPEVAEHFIKEHIPAGSKIVGDHLYYYAAIKSGSDYQYTHLFGTLETRERVLREEYQYEYFVVSSQLRQRQPDVVALFFENANFTKVASLQTSQSAISSHIARLGLISDMERDGYSGDIYKVVRKQ
jgi:4-amino-4-deoxy-L-arabinose transferase-like glycosyltransferase